MIKKQRQKLADLLYRLEDYMDDKADTVDGEEPTPNKEMSFLVEIRAAIEMVAPKKRESLINKLSHERDILIIGKTDYDEWLDQDLPSNKK